MDPLLFEALDEGRTARPSLMHTLGDADRRRVRQGDTEAVRDRAAVERSVQRLLEREVARHRRQ